MIEKKNASSQKYAHYFSYSWTSFNTNFFQCGSFLWDSFEVAWKGAQPFYYLILLMYLIDFSKFLFVPNTNFRCVHIAKNLL